MSDTMKKDDSKKTSGSKNKGSKSNKTAHVLNLLTESHDSPKKSASSLSIEAEPVPEIQITPDSVLSENIRGALEDELTSALEQEMEAELTLDALQKQAPEVAAAQNDTAPEAVPAAPEAAPAASAPMAAAPTESVPAEAAPAASAPAEAVPTSAIPAEPAASAETAPVKSEEPAPVSAPASSPVAPTNPIPASTSAPAAAEAVQTPVPDSNSRTTILQTTTADGVTYINVMQKLVEEKVDRYIKMFKLCSCARCKIDVIALALTSLPAKYVVVRERDLIPRLTVYESRFNTAVIAQIMAACKKVQDHPHHEE